MFFKPFPLGYRRKLRPDKFYLKCCNLACFSNTTQICPCNSLWEMPVCCLASKKDGSLYFLSKDVVGLPAAPRLHEAVGHLDPGVRAPAGDKVLGGIWDLLLLEELAQGGHALLQHLLVLQAPDGRHRLSRNHRHQHAVLLLDT